MIKFFALAAVLSTVPGQASANPACAVCTIAIGASLEIARKLGVEDAVVSAYGPALCLRCSGIGQLFSLIKRTGILQGVTFG